jgi:cell division control protein 6
MRYKIDALTEAAANYDDITIESVWLNCDELTSSYQVAIAIANTLLPTAEALPKSGLPKSQVYETMFETLDSLSTSDDTVRDYILVVLDEVDNIGASDRILYQFPRARANGKVDQVWLAVIGISNDVTFKEQLSTKVISSLCDREIVFSRYNAVQLAAIIRQRVGVAFTGGAVEENVIQLCAAYAVREGGDARYALDLLKVAADTARDRGDDSITEADLNDARAQVEDTRVLESVLSLNRHEQLAACVVS